MLAAAPPDPTPIQERSTEHLDRADRSRLDGPPLLFGAGAVAALLSLGYQAGISRTLGPAGYGAMASLTAVLTVAAVPVAAAQAATVQAAARDGRATAVTLIDRSVRLGAILVVLGALAGGPLDALLGIGDPLACALCGAWVGLAYGGATARGVLLGRQRWRAVSGQLVVSSTARLMLGVALTPSMGLVGAMVATVCAEAGATVAAIVPIWSTDARATGRELRRGHGDVGHALGTQLGLWVMATLGVVLARRVLHAQDAGQLAAAATATSGALFIPMALAGAMFPRFAAGVGGRALRRTVAAAVAIGVVLIVGAAVLGPLLVEVAAGRDFRPPVAIVTGLACCVAALGVAAVDAQYLLARRHPASMAPWVTAVAVTAVSLTARPGPNGFVGLLAVSGLVTAVVMTAIAFRLDGRTSARNGDPLPPSSLDPLDRVAVVQRRRSSALGRGGDGRGRRPHRARERDHRGDRRVDRRIRRARSRGSRRSSGWSSSRATRGRGPRLALGFAASRGDFVGYLDADGDLDPSVVDRLVRSMGPGIWCAAGIPLRSGDRRERDARPAGAVGRLPRRRPADLPARGARHPVRSEAVPSRRAARAPPAGPRAAVRVRPGAPGPRPAARARTRRRGSGVPAPSARAPAPASTAGRSSGPGSTPVACGRAWPRRLWALRRHRCRGRRWSTFPSNGRRSVTRSPWGCRPDAGPDVQLEGRGAPARRRGGGWTGGVLRHWVGAGDRRGARRRRRWPVVPRARSSTASRSGGAAATGTACTPTPATCSRRPGPFDLVFDQVNTRPFGAPRWAGRTPVIAIAHQVAREVWEAEVARPVALVGRHMLEPHWLRLYAEVPTFTVSRSSADSLAAYGLRRVEVLPQCADLPSPPACPVPKEETPTFVMCGRLSRSKRPDHAVDAFRLVARQMPEARLWIIGSGPLEERIARTLPAGAELLGRVPLEDRDRYMGRAHALLMTSVREGWGLVVSEAASVGTRTIALRRRRAGRLGRGLRRRAGRRGSGRPRLRHGPPLEELRDDDPTGRDGDHAARRGGRPLAAAVHRTHGPRVARMTTVLHVPTVGWSPREGVSRIVTELVAATPWHDHHLHTAGRHELTESRFASVSTSPGWLGSITFRRDFAARVRDLRPDVVHLHGGALIPALAAAPVLRDLPVVASIYGPFVPIGHRHGGIRSAVHASGAHVAPVQSLASSGLGAAVGRWALRSGRILAVCTPDPLVSEALSVAGPVLMVRGAAVRRDDPGSLVGRAGHRLRRAGRARAAGSRISSRPSICCGATCPAHGSDCCCSRTARRPAG